MSKSSLSLRRTRAANRLMSVEPVVAAAAAAAAEEDERRY